MTNKRDPNAPEQQCPEAFRDVVKQVGVNDFRTRRKSVTDELSEREPDDTKMIEKASVDELRGMDKVLTDEINRRRRLLNSVRKRIRQLGTAAKQAKDLEEK